MNHEILELISRARTAFDLTEASHQASVIELAERMLDFPIDDVQRAIRGSDAPLEAKIAAILAESRAWVLNSSERVKIGIVFAMWGEQNRLRPKSPDNPHGEDSLRTKLDQLEWICQGPIDWHLYAIDDGCPQGSAALAKEIAASHPAGNRVTVMSLSEHVPTESGGLRGLASADDSRKGGAIILGCEQALKEGVDAVIYTDADNSVHLGQVGILLRSFVDGASVVLGNRKHPDAVLVKEGARWGIGIKLLRHMQRMIGNAVFSRGILDTQAAFKLYSAPVLSKIIADPTVYDFSFDTDWILAALEQGEAISQVPFAFIDSAAESASITQGPMTTWETLLFGLIAAARRRGFLTGAAGEMANVVEGEIDGYRDLEKLINLLPTELESAAEADLGDPALMSPEAVRDWIREVIRGDN